MRNQTAAPLGLHQTDDGPPPNWNRSEAEQRMRRACLTAGVSSLLIVPFAVVGIFLAVQGLTSPGDAETTARQINASEGLFRLGIVSLFVNVALDTVVAWALYRVFRQVNEPASRLAAWLQIVFAGVFMAAVGELPGVVCLLGRGPQLRAFQPQ